MNGQNKLLGQHWLYDQTILEAVADATGVQDGDTVLEIGPGLGTLTTVLLAHGAQVIAVEKDDRLARQLLPHERLQVVAGDILTFNLNDLSIGYKVAANIPYYLTSPLIRMLLEADNRPVQIGLLIQKEVAERIVARPGKMSVLGFSVQYFADVQLGAVVSAELFDPPPKVDSQIITITPRARPAFPADQKKLFQLVKAGFSEKRKKLINALAGGLHLSKNMATALVKDAGMSETARAQELSLDDWQRLYETFEGMV